MAGIGGPTIRELVLTLINELPAETWVGLYTDVPGDDGSGTEVTGGDYARVEILAGDWTIDDDEARYTLDIAYPEATADWGTVLYWAILDDETAGDVVLWGEFGGAETDPIETGAIVTIPLDTLTYSFRPTDTASV
jgi:hypothetical protein